MPIQKWTGTIGALANLVGIKACEQFNRPDKGLGIYDRHMVDIPRNKFFTQLRYRANWPFKDGHYQLFGSIWFHRGDTPFQRWPGGFPSQVFPGNVLLLG